MTPKRHKLQFVGQNVMVYVKLTDILSSTLQETHERYI